MNGKSFEKAEIFPKIVRKPVVDRSPKRFYEFDQFRIDIEERRLLRNHDAVPLTPKVFDILLTLVENNGHTIEKNKLIETVWADSFVEEGNLNRNVSTLRKVLGEDSHEPRFITTVPKRGYRFDGDVREIVEEEEAVVVEKRTRYKVSIEENTETRTSFRANRTLVVAGAVSVVVLLGIVWAFVRPPVSDANSFFTPAKKEMRNAEAVALYEKARGLWQNRSVDGLHLATVDLERAVALDPEFALAHSALADAYAFDVLLWKKAESVANRAIELDPSLGQPHATIGFVRMFWEQKLNAADGYFKRAVTLSPDYATAHQWHALNLTATSNIGGGLAEIRRAVELDPASAAINADYCHILYLARKYDAAVEQCQKTLAIDPNLIAAHQLLYEIYTEKGMYSEAVDAYFKAVELNMTTPNLPRDLDRLKQAFETSGIRGFWYERTRMPAISNYSAGRYHARLGETDKAIERYELASKQQDFDYVFIAVDPVNAELLTDPRARALADALTER